MAEVEAMRSGTMSNSNQEEDSLTDQILRFCASGRFGVREAISAATMSRDKARRRVAGEQGLSFRTGSTTLTLPSSSTALEAGGAATKQP